MPKSAMAEARKSSVGLGDLIGGNDMMKRATFAAGTTGKRTAEPFTMPSTPLITPPGSPRGGAKVRFAPATSSASAVSAASAAEDTTSAAATSTSRGPGGAAPLAAATMARRGSDSTVRQPALARAMNTARVRMRMMSNAVLALSAMTTTQRLRYVCAKAPHKRTITELEHILRPILRNKFIEKLGARKRMQVAKVMRFKEFEEGE